MFEAVELGRKVDKEDFNAALPDLRAQLVQAQFAMQKTDSPVIVLISGVEAAGKAEVLNRLSQWLDIRGMSFHTFGRYTDEERMRPYWWRFWISLPERGRIGCYLGSWYTDPILRRVLDGGSQAELEQRLTEIRLFERMLALDGAIILKFWLHVPKKEQKKRLKKLDDDKSTTWRVTKKDWAKHAAWDTFVQAAETAIRETDTAEAPWYLVEAQDARYRDLTIANTIKEAMQSRLQAEGEPRGSSAALPPITAKAPSEAASITILDRVDLTRSLEAEAYKAELDALQERLGRLNRKVYEKGKSAVILFEGWDAAGKGGAIRRLTSALDARSLQVISIAAPTDEERAHHYLWRFWRHVPRSGHVTIYDRSWYGRVLVERVEGFARDDEWTRAYAEINNFEERLIDNGTVLVKFFLHISQEEQLARFNERENTPYKRHKITDEDWRNRDKWPRYEAAVNEMVARTSTGHAPWHLVPGNDKRYARVHVLRTVVEAFEGLLKGKKKGK